MLYKKNEDYVEKLKEMWKWKQKQDSIGFSPLENLEKGQINEQANFNMNDLTVGVKKLYNLTHTCSV